MKQLLLLFSFVFTLCSCNTADKKIAEIEITATPIDTTLKTKVAQLNITKDFVLGKFDYKSDSTFIKVRTELSAKSIFLKKEAYAAFLKMVDSAKANGIEFKILSGTRNFKEQKAIWERKWNTHKNLEPNARALKILEYSSMPSSSRHHWGTDLDLNSLNNSYFNSGKGQKEYAWLTANANTFGFYQVYTEKNKYRTGYNLEKWHWSYLPLASKYLEFYNNRIVNSDINGFTGSEEAAKVKIINNYVNGISQKAKDYK